MKLIDHEEAAGAEAETIALIDQEARPDSTLPKQAVHREAMQDPLAEEAEARRAAAAGWVRQGMEKLHAAALDPDTHLADMDVSYGRTREEGRAMLLTESYLRLQTLGRGFRTPLGRDIARDRHAREHFEGEGEGSDVAFAGQIRKKAQDVEDQKAIVANLQSEASLSELIRATDPGRLDLRSFVLWRERARTMPGWNPAREADYLEAWNGVRRQTHEKLEPDLRALEIAWNDIRNGKLDFSGIYGVLEHDSRREPFLAALTHLARTLSAEQQATLWSNFKKQGGRDIARKGKDLLIRLGDALIDDDMPEEIVALDPSEGWMNEERERKKRAGRNLDADIERIRDTAYDPVKVLHPDSPVLRALEEGLYALPGTAVSMGVAAVPVGGPGLTYLHLKESGYRNLRRTLMDANMGDAEASEVAGLAADFMAVPDMLLEVAGGRIAAGKVAPVEKAVALLANRLQGRFVRGASRFGAKWALETGIEVGQGLIQPMTHAILAATDGTIPAPVMSNGRDGYFDGFWQQTAATAVTMAPFAFFGALSGRDSRGRTKVYESATDLELRAFGHDAASVDRLRAAGRLGRHQFERAIEAEQAGRRPLSRDAEEAVKELEARLTAQENALGAAQDVGAWPVIRMHPGGGTWTVHDPEDGREVGAATGVSDAIRIGREHFEGMAAAEADRIAVLSTQMEAAVATASRDGAARQTTVEFLPGMSMDAAEMSRRSAVDAERVRAQLIAAEQVSGVTENIAARIFGESRTEFEGRQRHTINRIFADGTIFTVFHEDMHGFRREARASGRITREEEIAFLRMLDGAMAGKKDKSGQPIRFLPEGLADEAVSDLHLDEAMSELAEAEILRTRRAHKSGVMEVPAGLVTRHMKALVAANPRVAGKFKAFFEAMRGYFGIALRRAVVLEKGFRDGTLDRGKYDEHLDKVLGLGEHAGDVESKYGSDRSGMAIPEGFGKLLGSFSLDDGSAGSRRQDEFVHKVWSALAQHDELFQYGRTTSKDAGEIAKAVSLPGMEVRAEDHGNWIGFEGKNGFLAVLNADTDRPVISSPLADSRSGGRTRRRSWKRCRHRASRASRGPGRRWRKAIRQEFPRSRKRETWRTQGSGPPPSSPTRSW
jgi:hypothetical protein